MTVTADQSFEAPGEDQEQVQADSSSFSLRDQLQAVLAYEWQDGNLKIDSMEIIPGGSSRKTYKVAITFGNGSLGTFILRMDPIGVTRSTSLVLEAAIIDAVREAGCPVPQCYLSNDDPTVLGAPFLLLDYVEGYSQLIDVRRVKELEKVRSNFGKICGEVLAKIHSAKYQNIPGLPAFDLLQYLRAQLDQLKVSNPVFELALRILEQNRPKPVGQCLVHGDFRLGNIIFGEDGVRSVIDWELAHIGDPLEDLGWLCLRPFRASYLYPVGGFSTYNSLVFSYEHASGRAFDVAVLKWWEVLSSVRFGVMCLMRAKAFSLKTHRDLVQAVYGRRVAEAEFEVLNLLRNRKF